MKILHLRPIIVILLLHTAFFAKAEVWPHYSIVELAFESEKVVVASLLTHDSTQFVFQTHNLIDKNADSDTLILTARAINNIFLPLKDGYGYELTRFENADSVIIYLNERNLPVWSGFRLLRNDVIYQPRQWEIPGRYRFQILSDRIDWSEMKNRIRSSWQRVTALKQLRDITDPAARNQALFQFIEQEKDEFGVRCARNMDCGWEIIGYQVFQWITEAGIMEDTWRASQLRRQIRLYPDSYEYLPLQMLGDAGKPSFSSYEGVEFLFSKIFNTQLTQGDRLQALSYLGTAIRVVFEYKKEHPQYRSERFQRKMQCTYLERLLPLLRNQEFQVEAFRSIAGLIYPRQMGIEERNELQFIPLLVDVYNSEKSYKFKTQLAEFYVYQLSENQWKDLTHSEQKILVTLGSWTGLDHTKKTLYVPLSYLHGKVEIKSYPTVHIESLMNKKRTYRFSFIDKNTALPLKSRAYLQAQKFDVTKLPAGKYKFYLKGVAGQQNQYQWQSQVAYFEK